MPLTEQRRTPDMRGGGRSAVEQADQHKIYALISLQKAHNLKSVLVWKNQSEASDPSP